MEMIKTLQKMDLYEKVVFGICILFCILILSLILIQYI